MAGSRSNHPHGTETCSQTAGGPSGSFGRSIPSGNPISCVRFRVIAKSSGPQRRSSRRRCRKNHRRPCPARRHGPDPSTAFQQTAGYCLVDSGWDRPESWRRVVLAAPRRLPNLARRWSSPPHGGGGKGEGRKPVVWRGAIRRVGHARTISVLILGCYGWRRLPPQNHGASWEVDSNLIGFNTPKPHIWRNWIGVPAEILSITPKILKKGVDVDA